MLLLGLEKCELDDTSPNSTLRLNSHDTEHMYFDAQLVGLSLSIPNHKPKLNTLTRLSIRRMLGENHSTMWNRRFSKRQISSVHVSGAVFSDQLTAFGGRCLRIPYCHNEDIVACLIAHPIPLVLGSPLQIHTLLHSIVHYFLNYVQIGINNGARVATD